MSSSSVCKLLRTPFALVVDANGTRVRITPVPELVPAALHDRRLAGSDITATARTLADRGSPLFVGDQPERGEDPALLVPDHHLVGDVAILDAEATRSAEKNQRVERDPGQVTDFSPVSDDLVELGALLVREKDRRRGID
jgi:hypothetical protein